MTVTTYIDGTNAIATIYTNMLADNVTALKVPVGRVGNDLTIELTQTTTSAALIRVLAYEIDAQVLGHH